MTSRPPGCQPTPPEAAVRPPMMSQPNATLSPRRPSFGSVALPDPQWSRGSYHKAMSVVSDPGSVSSDDSASSSDGSSDKARLTGRAGASSLRPPSSSSSRRGRRRADAPRRPTSPMIERSTAALLAVSRKIGSASRRITSPVKSRSAEPHSHSQSRRLPDVDDSDSDASVRLRTANSQLPSAPILESISPPCTDRNHQTPTIPSPLASPEGLVGNSLGVFSPENRFRRVCWHVLRQRATDPVLLLLVLANVILIIVQAERPVGTRAEAPYFRRWEDYCLVVLFAIFTVEAIARIVVSGLLLDPHTTGVLAATDASGGTKAAADGSDFYNSRLSTDSADSDESRRDPKVAFRRAIGRLRAVLALSGTSSENARRRAEIKRKGESGTEQSDSSDDDVSLSISPLVMDTTVRSSPPLSTLFSRRRQRGAKGVAPSFIASKLATTLPVSLIAHPVPPPAQVSPANPTPTLVQHLRRALRSIELPFQRSLLHERQIQLLGRPYLRHSWNRVDAVAILCFWTMLGLALTEHETQNGLHLFIFRALSILRASRLLLVTSGTATILHSLKRAAPLLANAFALFLAALSLMSIIGVQAFSGSYRRSCYFVSPSNASDLVGLGRTCGSWYDPASATVRGAVLLADHFGDAVGSVKGFTCPPPQICAIADENLATGQTFDNVLGSALQVFIISSANGWSPNMFDMMDSDYFAASLFFIIGLVVLNFWLSQLGIAIIISSFHDVRAETRRSAFGGKLSAALIAPLNAAASIVRPSRAAIFYQRSRYLWVALAIASLAARATLSAGSSVSHIRLISHLNLAFAAAFGLEMVLRFLSTGPGYRAFFVEARNWLDLILAAVSLVIEVPLIRSSKAYGWLAIFPLARWYRVILVVPRMKPLLLAVFGQIGGLLNMTAFLGLNILLGAILAIQLFQDDIEQDGETLITFHSLYNALLGMFQIMTSENWTDPLNNAMAAEWPFKQGVLSALFLCSWFVFSNFVMLQMFVACVSENFSVAADSEKRERQLQFWLGAAHAERRQVPWYEKLDPRRLFSAKPAGHRAPKLPPSLVLPSKPAIFRNATDLDAQGLDYQKRRRPSHFGLLPEVPVEEGMVDYICRVLWRPPAADSGIALVDLGPKAGTFLSRTPAAGSEAALDQQQEQMRLFISRHPSWDWSLFLIPQGNIVRRLCQRVVPSPAGGVRVFGLPASPAATFALKACVCLTVIASVVTAAVATPAYRRDRYDPDADSIAEWPWYDVVDCSIALLFTIELVIKAVADGLLLGPSPYLHSPWNALDGIVYVGLLINTITTVTSVGGLNVFTRALKAVRCLRLISISTRLRATVTSVLRGASRILDASVLVVLYLIPYAVWGVGLFRGRLFRCNNDAGRADCIGEYLATPVDGVGAGFPLPQVWANPTLDQSLWSFDDFRQSILILFEIVSLEGWTSVMGSLMAITAKGQQPRINASPGNALFLIFFMLFGAVIILTLFVSIIISSFSARSGAALLTTEQRHWVDLRKSIWQQQPSRKPKERPTGFRSWCFDRAASKGGWWTQSLGVVYVAHCATLLSQTYDNSAPGGTGDTARDYLYLGLCVMFAVDLVVRYLGLGWVILKTDKWSLFRAAMVAGAGLTTALSLGSPYFRTSVVGQLQKVFLVGICLNLIERSGRLSQLFKTALASLPAISNLFLLWLVLFGFYGVMFLEAFGLTKHNTQENRYISFRTFPTSLVMLAVFTNGEGWNGYMHDYAISWPRCTKDDNLYLRSDCGSEPAAYLLFASWNVLSMYLFVNVVTAAVVESFSYVFYLPGKTSLSRQQLRAYKKAWAETDVDRTGRISRGQVGTLLYKLSGVLEVKIYPSELSVRNLVAFASAPAGAAAVVKGARACVNPRKLKDALCHFDYDLVKQRRQRFERLFREATLANDISFAAMLELLAHHVLIDDELALLLDELLPRRELADHIQQLIDVAKVESFLLATVCRRRRRRRLTLRASPDGLHSIVPEPTPPQEPGSSAALGASDNPL